MYRPSTSCSENPTYFDKKKYEHFFVHTRAIAATVAMAALSEWVAKSFDWIETVKNTIKFKARLTPGY